MHPNGSVAGFDLVYPFLMLVPLLLGDQQFGQRTVDALHQGVGRQAGPEHQLAGAVQQHRLRVSIVVVGCFAGGSRG